MVTNATENIWRSGDNCEIQFSPFSIWGLALEFRLDGKCPYLLGHLASPRLSLSVKEQLQNYSLHGDIMFCFISINVIFIII